MSAPLPNWLPARRLPLPLVLASQSPRRAQLLNEAGWEFSVFCPAVEEAHDASLTPAALTMANARLKALCAAGQRPESLVLAADTLVYIDDEPLGKPADLAEAAVMLQRLSGRTHTVCTGVVLSWAGGEKLLELHELTEVCFQELTATRIQEYHRLVNPLDKAGAYGIQEHAELILKNHEGSWSNVMGLPMERVNAALNSLAKEHLSI
jgi:septum formation protein